MLWKVVTNHFRLAFSILHPLFRVLNCDLRKETRMPPDKRYGYTTEFSSSVLFVHYSLPVTSNIQFPWALRLRSLFWVEIATLETVTVYKYLGLHVPHVHYFTFPNTQSHLSLCGPVSQEFEMLLQLLRGILVSIIMNNSVLSANIITLLLSILSKSLTSVFRNTAPSGKPCRTLLAMLSIIKPK